MKKRSLPGSLGDSDKERAPWAEQIGVITGIILFTWFLIVGVIILTAKIVEWSF